MEKILMRNLLIYMYLHCVRRLSWSATTLDTLVYILPFEEGNAEKYMFYIHFTYFYCRQKPSNSWISLQKKAKGILNAIQGSHTFFEETIAWNRKWKICNLIGLKSRTETKNKCHHFLGYRYVLRHKIEYITQFGTGKCGKNRLSYDIALSTK